MSALLLHYACSEQTHEWKAEKQLSFSPLFFPTFFFPYLNLYTFLLPNSLSHSFSFCLHVCMLLLLTVRAETSTHPVRAYQGMCDSEAARMNCGSLIPSQGLTKWWRTAVDGNNSADRRWGHSHMVPHWRACAWSSKVLHGLRLVGDVKSWYLATKWSWELLFFYLEKRQYLFESLLICFFYPFLISLWLMEGQLYEVTK